MSSKLEQIGKNVIYKLCGTYKPVGGNHVPYIIGASSASKNVFDSLDECNRHFNDWKNDPEIYIEEMWIERHVTEIVKVREFDGDKRDDR